MLAAREFVQSDVIGCGPGLSRRWEEVTCWWAFVRGFFAYCCAFLLGVGILLNFHLLKIRVRYAQNSILLYKVFGQWASSYVGWTYGGIESVRTMSLS
jgi:hypothetical protein